MKLGFVSAIVPELSLTELFELAQSIGYETIELMCWPVGAASRRYAGVTHVDVVNLNQAKVDEIKRLSDRTGVTISGLGYYPNPLSPDNGERSVAVEHLSKVILGAKLLDVGVVNTFVGRDWRLSVDDNWPAFLDTFRPLVELAESLDLKLAIENCPMLFSKDEWPGGKNLATSPVIWRRMFADMPYANFGLNFDPSHLIWQFIDVNESIHEFGERIHHVHLKDTRIDWSELHRTGILGFRWHTPKLPGYGDVNWGQFFGALTDIRYTGPVCVEVEDRAFENSLHDRIRSLKICYQYLRQYVG